MVFLYWYRNEVTRKRKEMECRNFLVNAKNENPNVE
jgi:hypothetical protein